MQETILINGMSRPISNTNENLIPPIVETREVTREYRDISKEVFSTIYEEKLQTSKTLEDFEKRIQRMEVAVNHMESDIWVLLHCAHKTSEIDLEKILRGKEGFKR